MRRLLLAAGAAALLVPAAAGATVTASSVDTPAGPYFDESNGHLIITGHVTSDAPATDKVKVVCPGATEAKGPGNAGYSIAPDGSVSADVGTAFDYWYCPARIVPLSDAGPTYSDAFAPSLIGVDERLDYPVTPSGSDWYDWYQSAAGPGGYADGYSLGDCPIDSTYTRTTDNGYVGLLGCSGVSNPADTSKSAIALDGVPALTPYHVYNASFPNPPVIQNLHHSISAQTGDVTATDTEPLSLCPASCSAPTDAGAHVDHSWHADHGGGLVTEVDVWHNDRSQPLTLDVGYAFQISGSQGAIQLPGAADFATITDGPLTTPAAGPGFLRIRHDSTPDGDAAGARGTVGWSTAPDSLTGDAADDAVVLNYHRTIPAGGSLRLTFGTSTAIAQADADALAGDLVAATKPAVAISAPDDNSTTMAASVSVTGTSSDDGGPPAVKVNGVDATVAGDGTWTAQVPLSIGANTLTATATDADGNTAAATRTVTREQPPAPPAFAAKLSGVKVKQAKNGTLTVTATVNAAGKLSATLSAKQGKKTKVIGRARKTAAKAGRVSFKLKPSKAVLKRLRTRSLKSTLKLTFTAQGKTAKATKKVTLKKRRR